MTDLKELTEAGRDLLGEEDEFSSLEEQDSSAFYSPYPHVELANEPLPTDEISYYTGTQNLGGPGSPPYRAREGDDLVNNPYQGRASMAHANLSNAVMYLRQAYEFLDTARNHLPAGTGAKQTLDSLYKDAQSLHVQAMNVAREING
jgi:hypothetical protein